MTFFIDILCNDCFPSLSPKHKLTNEANTANTDFVKTGLIYENYKNGSTFRSKETVLGPYP